MKYVMYDENLDWVVVEDSIPKIKEVLNEFFVETPGTDFGAITIVRGEELKITHRHTFKIK